MIPADKIERAERIVYEYLTGKCWHRWERRADVYGCECAKCGEFAIGLIYYANNPKLATDLNAWIPIWAGMSDEQKSLMIDEVFKLTNGYWASLFDKTSYLLEAALQLTVPCDKCGESRSYCTNGEVMRKDTDMSACPQSSCMGCEFDKPCTCKDGIIKLADKIKEG